MTLSLPLSPTSNLPPTAPLQSKRKQRRKRKLLREPLKHEMVVR
jgi:hypothetical protein